MAVQRVSATALAPTSRVKVEDLTTMEREAMAAQGQVGPEGFLDIEKPEPPALVDLKANARKEAAARLRSVTEQGAQKPLEVPEELVDRAADAKNAEYAKTAQKEIADLQAKVQSRSPCPRCGLGIEDTCEVKPTQADIAEFLRCVLGGLQFSKEVRLFGGALTLTLVTRDGSGEEMIRRVVTDALRSKELLSETEAFAFMRQLTIAAALKSYVTADLRLEYGPLPMTSAAEFRRAAEERMAKIPAQIQAALRPVVTDFHVLVDILTARAQDPNFWAGTPA